MIRQLGVHSFKGLRAFDVKPQRVNLLIGANGTGKTNFADLIAFIASLCPRGLAAAIEDLGGLERVRTRQPGAGKPYKLQIEFHLGEDPSRGIQRAAYRFALAQSKELCVHEESLDAVVYKRKSGRPKMQGIPLFDVAQPVELRYKRNGKQVTDWSDNVGPAISEFDNERELILASYARLGELRTLSDYLSSWRVYNIDAMVAKQSTGGSDAALERHGGNIVPYVARMLGEENREQLLKDLQEAVPYIKNIEPDHVLTFQTLRFWEDSGADFQLPDMSDGTIRLLGLLAVLRQPIPPAVVVIEEPENAMHRYAINHFLAVARQVAMSKKFASQMFFTSHSPAVVDEVLSIEAQKETGFETGCFVTTRKPKTSSIFPVPEEVVKAIAQNMGRPSDFQREGSLGDEPQYVQLELALETPEEA